MTSDLMQIKTAEFTAYTESEEVFTVEEVTHHQRNDDALSSQTQFVQILKRYQLRDDRPGYDMQPVDLVSGNDYKIRRDDLIITRKP